MQESYWALHAGKYSNKIYDIMQGSYWALHTGKYSNKIYDTVARIILSSSTPANIQNKIYTTKA